MSSEIEYTQHYARHIECDFCGQMTRGRIWAEEPTKVKCGACHHVLTLRGEKMDKHKLAHGEYVLTDKSAWIEVKNFVVRICATDEGVEADIYRNGIGNEMSLPVASAYATD